MGPGTIYKSIYPSIWRLRGCHATWPCPWHACGDHVALKQDHRVTTLTLRDALREHAALWWSDVLRGGPILLGIPSTFIYTIAAVSVPRIVIARGTVLTALCYNPHS